MAALVYLDTETTGKDETARLCQVAFIVERSEGTHLTQTLCKPPDLIDYFSMAIHHITNEMVEDAPEFAQSEAKKELSALNAQDSLLIAHNAPFDLAILRCEGFIWHGQTLDTCRAARHILSDLPSHALQYLRYALGLYKDEAKLAAKFGINAAMAHDAAGDTIVLYLLTEYLMKKVGGDVMELLRLANAPVEIKTLRFGKYKGKRFDEVAKSDRGYLNWLREQKINDPRRTEADDDVIRAIDRALEGGKAGG